MPIVYGMVGGLKYPSTQKAAWEGQPTRKCPKCGFERPARLFIPSSRWCEECRLRDAAAKAERRRQRQGRREPRFDGHGRPIAREVVADAELGRRHAAVYAWLNANCDVRGMVKSNPAAIARDIGRSTEYVNDGLKGLESVGRIKRTGRGDATAICVYLCPTPLRISKHSRG